MPAEHWQDITLVPVPCLRVLAFRFPVNDYFTKFHRAQQRPDESKQQAEEEKLAIPRPADQFIALSRRDYIVRRYALEQLEFELLRGLVAGQSIGQAVEAVAASSSVGDLEDLAEKLQQWFRKWTGAGFFQAMNMP